MPYADTGEISLHYEDAGPLGDASGAPPVLLPHEPGGCAESWRAMMLLLARDRRVIAMDFRGAGQSEKPPLPFALETLADDAAALLRCLNVSRADVVGGALGSLVGVLLTGRHPALIRRLALFAVSGDMNERTAAYVSDRANRVRREGMRPVADASLANAFLPAHTGARSRYRPMYQPRERGYLSHDPAGYAALSLALAGVTLDPPVWEAVRAPSLVCSGTDDFIWPPEHGRRAAARIAGARFKTLTEAGHFPHLQTPEAATLLAQRFFLG